MSKQINASVLRELLHYEPTTGVFTHKKKRQKVIVGQFAGCRKSNGYRKHQISGVTYLEHRLAWLYVTGAWPRGQIDHINGNRSDNRIANLRDVSVLENRQNLRHAQGAVGLLGVSKKRNKFHAEITVDYKRISLGSHPSAELAHSKYIEAKRQLHAGCTI